MEDNNRQPHDPTFSDIPYDQRWDYLRPTIEALRNGEGKALKDIVRIMKERYGFDASENQYKYRFSKWNLKQSLDSAQKRKLADKLEDRALQKKSRNPGYVVVTHKGKAVDLQKVSREIKKELNQKKINMLLRFEEDSIAGRDEGLSILQERNFFLKWRLPYEAMVGVAGLAEYSSPFGGTVSTPSDMAVSTPEGTGVFESQTTIMSSFESTLQLRSKVRRAGMFSQGRHLELVKDLDRKERLVASTWMHQFWLFAFTTAQNWGYGPRQWTAELLGFENLPELNAAASPAAIEPSPVSSPNLATQSTRTRSTSLLPGPSQLCKWAIHIKNLDYEETPEGNQSRTDLISAQPWPTELDQPSFQERLVESLQTNEFSNIPPEEIPLSNEEIAIAAQKSPGQLLLESISFAIIGRNVELLDTLLCEARETEVDISDIRPLHLAASYLDGSRTCCQIFYLLTINIPFRGAREEQRELMCNELGHTVLDIILLRVLVSHSSIDVSTIAREFQGQRYWQGQEVDICGRWDANSEVYQSLLKSGDSSIPISWKHKFCHTSAQAVAHSIQALSFYNSRMPSGLFRRLCANCGSRLTLPPLHALVMISWSLANHALEGEDLFGIISTLFSLIKVWEDPAQAVEISLRLLFGEEQINVCDHQKMTAADFAFALENNRKRNPFESEILNLGWSIFVKILRKLENAKLAYFGMSDAEIDDSNTESDDGDAFAKCGIEGYDEEPLLGYFSFFPTLSHIQAAVEGELLNYRRIQINGAWLSQNFDFSKIKHALETNSKPSIPLLDGEKLKQYCRCGTWQCSTELPLRREDISKIYFSNLDIWERSTFIDDTLMLKIKGYL